MSETLCPNCGEAKERIAQHWAMSSCGYPDLSTDQRVTLDGLVLSGATVTGNGNNRHVRIGTTSRALAEWTADQLGWLHHGTRVEQGDGNRSDVFRVRTSAHPACNRYERWASLDENRGRQPPDDFSLSPRAGRVWWAFSGGIEWAGPYDSQRTGGFSADDDAKQAWILRVLRNAGFDPTPADRRVRLPPSELRAWLDWVGDPVTGVEHKWSNSVIDYRARQAEARSEAEYKTARYTIALEIARDRTGGELTAAQFDRRVDVVDAADVADWLGGGSWEDACRVAGVDRSGITSSTGGQDGQAPPSDGLPEHMYEKQRITEQERDAALLAAARSTDGALTKAAYEDWREAVPDAPASSTITSRWGWVPVLENLGIEPSRKYGYTVEDLLAAICRIHEDLGEWPTITQYDERTKSYEPARDWLYRVNPDGIESWSGAITATKEWMEAGEGRPWTDEE